jgi:hypothetical protein
MSMVSIRKALETALAGMTPPLATAWENVLFNPTTGVPYQQVNLLAADPNNPSMGDKFRQEVGIFQITLKYTMQTGPGAADARAELLRSIFHRGATFTADGITVTIDRTPTVSMASQDGDRWSLPVKIRWYANIST